MNPTKSNIILKTCRYFLTNFDGRGILVFSDNDFLNLSDFQNTLTSGSGQWKIKIRRGWTPNEETHGRCKITYCLKATRMHLLKVSRTNAAKHIPKKPNIPTNVTFFCALVPRFGNLGSGGQSSVARRAVKRVVCPACQGVLGLTPNPLTRLYLDQTLCFAGSKCHICRYQHSKEDADVDFNDCRLATNARVTCPI